jgi:hypothetical protein
MVLDGYGWLFFRGGGILLLMGAWDEIDLDDPETQKMTPAKKAREDELDEALRPIVKEAFSL